MKTELFDIFTPKQIRAIKDCIKFGLWGNTSCVFAGDKEETLVNGYMTSDIYKGGNFSNKQISGICSGISKLIDSNSLNWIQYQADAWGDGNNGIIYFHLERLQTTTEELSTWASSETEPD